MNKVILIGRLGKDAETKEINNQNLITFSLATSETYKDKNGEKVEATEWHNVAYWSKSKKITEYLKKGILVSIEGKIKTTKKEDKYYTNIQANDIEILEFAKDKPTEVVNNDATMKSPQTEEIEMGNDFLPF